MGIEGGPTQNHEAKKADFEKPSDELFYGEQEKGILNRARLTQELHKQREGFDFAERQRQREEDDARKLKELTERLEKTPDSLNGDKDEELSGSSAPQSSQVFQSAQPPPRAFQAPQSPSMSQGTSKEYTRPLLKGVGNLAGSLIGVGAATILSPFALLMAIGSPKEARRFLGNTISLFRKGGEAVGDFLGKRL